jgi:hypothetical protein
MGRSAEPVSPLLREVTTMVLYVSVVLLATLAAVPIDELGSDAEVAALLWGAAIGLALAHWFAFHVSAQLYSGGGVSRAEVVSGAAQTGAALAVAFVATLPLLVAKDDVAVAVSVIDLTIVITFIGYTSSRRAGVGHTRALVRAVITVVAGLVVAGIKVWVEH